MLMSVLFLTGCFEDATDPVLNRQLNADLSDLMISPGDLSPAFSTAVSVYSTAVQTNLLRVSATAAGDEAQVYVNGIRSVSGQPVNVSLSQGQNAVTVIVQDRVDGVSKTKRYVLNVTRLGSGPALTVGYNGLVLESGAVVDLGLLVSGLSNSITFGITNTGSSELQFTGTPARAVMSGDSEFSLLQDLPATLASTSNSEMKVEFAPASDGVFSNTVYITNNSALSPFVINFIGEGSSDPVSLLTNLYITEWADAGTDVDYIELRNFGTTALFIDSTLRINFGSSTSASLVSWGTSNDTNQWQDVSAGSVMIAPGEVIVVTDSDLLNPTDGTVNYDKFVNDWSMPAETKVFMSSESTLIGSNDRLDENRAWLSYNSTQWGHTPTTADFTPVGTGTYSTLKTGFDPAVSSSSNADNWLNGSTEYRTPGTWE